MLTEGEKLRAQRLQICGSSYAAIGQKLGKPPAEVRKLLSKYVGKPRGRHKQIVEDLKNLKIGRAMAGINHGWAEPPAEVLAERDARQDHQSTTSALMGDPLPGRSAWDKRQLHVVR